jgi:MFS family permease
MVKFNMKVSSRDVRLVLGAQALRAFAYGLGTVLLGRTLASLHFSTIWVGAIFGSIISGTAIASIVIAKFGDYFGRRRSYALMYAMLALTGAVYAFSSNSWAFLYIGILGVMSTDVIESGPFTSIEQSMLSSVLSGRKRINGFGIYNAVAAISGSFGALCAVLPELTRKIFHISLSDQRWFLVFVPVSILGFLLALALGKDVETGANTTTASRTRHLRGLIASRKSVRKLALLFSIDSFAGGLTISAFIAYWLTVHFHASSYAIAITFSLLGMLQTASFLIAPFLAHRFGLLKTMVFTHLPSNILLGAIAFAPTLKWALLLLAMRTCLSQMDIPTRQAYVMELVTPSERTAAAAYTNTARYVTRPLGPLAGSALQNISIGLPFLAGGLIKIGYDLFLWSWFRKVPLRQED